jgi:hypothetical protein
LSTASVRAPTLNSISLTRTAFGWQVQWTWSLVNGLGSQKSTENASRSIDVSDRLNTGFDSGFCRESHPHSPGSGTLAAGLYLRRSRGRNWFSGDEDMGRACAHRHSTVGFRRVSISIAPLAALSQGHRLTRVPSRGEEVKGIQQGNSDARTDGPGTPARCRGPYSRRPRMVPRTNLNQSGCLSSGNPYIAPTAESGRSLGATLGPTTR